MALTFTCHYCKESDGLYWGLGKLGRKNRLYKDGKIHHIESGNGEHTVGCVGVGEAKPSAGIPVSVMPSSNGWHEELNATATKAQQAWDMALNTAQGFAKIGTQAQEALMQVQQIDLKWERKLNESRPITIRHEDREFNVGRQHRKFPELVRKCISSQGKGLVFLVGEPGSMKTSAIRPLALALGALPYYIISMNQQTSRSELLGYMNGHGLFTDSPLYKAFIEGGVVLLDEIDASNANCLTAANALATNDSVTFPNGETVNKHPKFYLVCAGNTIGAGATPEFIGRVQLDMATRTRFVGIRWDTDWDLVSDICHGINGNRPWVIKVKRLHDVALEKKVKFVVSSRVAIVGAQMIADGFDEDEVLDSMVWMWISRDERTAIEAGL